MSMPLSHFGGPGARSGISSIEFQGPSNSQSTMRILFAPGGRVSRPNADSGYRSPYGLPRVPVGKPVLPKLVASITNRFFATSSLELN